MSTTMTPDRTDPEMVRALDDAARVAENLLERHNSDAYQELALDVLNDYVEFGIVRGFLAAPVGAGRGRRLAWALTLTERRDDLKPHESKLLDLAWDRVREDALQAEWEQMGLR